MKLTSYVEVHCYNEVGDPVPPKNYRVELQIGEYSFIADTREDNDFNSKEKANEIARKIASSLGIEAKLKE